MKKLTVLILVLCLVLAGCGENASAGSAPTLSDPPPAQWEMGSISSKNGTDRNVARETAIRTVGYLELARYGGVLPDTGYAMNWFAYDGQKEYLGSGISVMGNGVGISVEEIRERYEQAVYFRLILRSAYADGRIVLEETPPVRFYTAREGWPGAPMEKERVASLAAYQTSGVQDGEVFGDRLFAFSADGTANVYDVHTGELIDSFLLGSRDRITPHVNSASFSDRYYASGDGYPLLYTSVYNNLTAQGRLLLGTSCVYRITESGGQFAAQLVQMIRVSFTGDTQLWASPISNERPYGNFVVDTDRDRLYAFVPRDDSQKTRFFAFELPTSQAGSYSSTYDCRLVTLDAGDILRCFDVDYFSSPQGCCYADGKILSLEGFGSYESAPPFLRVVDVETGTLERSVNLGQLGLEREPETVTVGDGQIYFMAWDGILYKLKFTEQE